MSYFGDTFILSTAHRYVIYTFSEATTAATAQPSVDTHSKYCTVLFYCALNVEESITFLPLSFSAY